MKPLLALSRAIDTVNRWIGAIVIWFVLAAVLISAGNAVLRKLFNVGSNAYLELQWYLFAAMFLLGAAYTFLRNAHVRIDFVSTRLSPRVRNWVDIVGIVVFLLPLTLLLICLSWPFVANAYVGGEMSQNAGGLIRWPVYALLPAGMALLLAQGTFRADQAHRVSARNRIRFDSVKSTIRWRRRWSPSPTRSAAMSFIAQNFVPLIVSGAVRFSADRLSGRVLAGRHWVAVRFSRHVSGLIPGHVVPGAAAARLRHHAERHAARRFRFSRSWE